MLTNDQVTRIGELLPVIRARSSDRSVCDDVHTVLAIAEDLLASHAELLEQQERLAGAQAEATDKRLLDAADALYDTFESIRGSVSLVGKEFVAAVRARRDRAAAVADAKEEKGVSR